MWIFLCLQLIFLYCFCDVTETLSIRTVPNPDPSTIDVLQFSPGPVDFYERYLQKNKPVIVQEAVTHWPSLKQWGDKEYLSKLLKTEDKNIFDLFHEHHYVCLNITKESLLSHDLLLPFVIQCEELVKHLPNIKLSLNQQQKGQVTHNGDEILLMPLFHDITVFIFGINQTWSGADLKGIDLRNFDLDASPHVQYIPHQSYDVKPGDLIYLPRYSWFYLETGSENLNYLTYSFELFPYQQDVSMKFTQFLEDYRSRLSKLPSTITCKNNRITVHDVLKINVEDFEQNMHLRIPRRNKKPEDVVLASGYKMPVLGLGTALLNETTYDAIKYALEVGYRLFDLAYGYPICEVSFAKAMAKSTVPRKDVFVVTKLHPRFLGYKETLEAIDLSLSNLNVSYIDLYLIHSLECDDYLLACEEGEPKGTWKESWRAMEKAKRDGKIRSLGFSNIYQDDIYELLNWSEEPVSVIQNWFDPYNQDKETRDICTKNNIRYMGFSTLGSRWKMMGLDYNPIMESDTITGIAGHYDYVVSHVILRWAIHVNVTVIPRSGNPKHISQNLRSLEISLFDADINELNSMESAMKEVLELEEDF